MPKAVSISVAVRAVMKLTAPISQSRRSWRSSSRRRFWLTICVEFGDAAEASG